MLGVVRRYGVAQALRASAPRSLHVRSTQLLKWQPSSIPKAPSAIRSLHNSTASWSTAAASVQEDFPAQSDIEPLREFIDLRKQGLVDPTVVDTIVRKMKIQTMTDVQSKTLRETLKGGDILAQAKTGTGKTLAFLIPVLQNLMDNKPGSGHGFQRRMSPTEVRSIIISPTRELAEQIAVQARLLAQGTGVAVQTAVGGTGKREGLMRIRKMGCDLLIGTPGRLKDILSDPMSGVKTSNLSSLVLDEADRLLDQGFAPEIMEIQSLLPSPNKVDRQTLMFSATVPKEVLHVVRGTMKPNFQFVKTVRDDEVPTHLSVPQKLVMLKGLENGLPAVLEIAQKYKDQEKQNPSLRPFKAIVYYNTTSEVTLAYEACLNLRRFTDLGRSMGDTRFHYIHSRLTQGRRTLNADSFRKARSGVLLSSDVTARGMDFPDVTHVIQVGLPRGRDSYIHRVGRTARANKTGEAWCLMHRKQYDAFLDFVGDLPVERDNSLVSANANMSSLASCTPEEMKFVDPVNMAMAEASPTAKREAYMSQVNGAGYRSKRDMIQTLNAFATVGMKLPEPPSISPMLASKLGLDRTPGVNIGARVPYMEMVGGERGMSRGGFNDRGRGMSRGRFDGGDRRSSRGGFDRPSFADRRGDSFDDRFSGKPRLSNDRNDPRRRRGSLF